jgi:hypothetical protein
VRILPVVWLIVVSLIACAGSSHPRGSLVDSSDHRAQAPDEWSAESLDVQSRMALLERRTSPETGYRPGTSPWTPIPDEVQAMQAATPGSLLMRVVSSQHWADALGDAMWEQTTRVLIDERGLATGVVLQWGMMDDAVAGRDFRVSMKRIGDAWAVAGVERRFHCRRGVSPGGQCQ